MANMNFGVNILPKANNTYSLGNSSYKWHAYLIGINGTAIEDLILPTVDSTDNGKILQVSSGAWSIVTPNFLTSHQDISGLAPKADPVFTGSISMGRTETTGINSIALGTSAKASGQNSFAAGAYVNATGNYSFAMGYTANAKALHAFAQGYNIQASGAGSHAYGRSTIANASHSFAMGSANQEFVLWPVWTANTSYQVGDRIRRYDDSSTGYICQVANSDSSFTSGNWTEVRRNSDFAYVFGNGTDQVRSNAYTLEWNGTGRYSGDLYVNCNTDSTGGYKVATESYVTTAIANASIGGGSSVTLATVATTGDYDDLINKPNLSQYLTSVPSLVGATSSVAGTAGLVPAPTTSDTDKFLRGDGTWATPSSGITGVTLVSTSLIPSNGVVTIPAMTGATSSAAGTAGLAPAPTSADVDKFLAGDGTYKSGGLPMVILSYGNSTWAEFESAYNNNVIVYCRASSNANPASGSKTRMAFMAYVNNSTTPTNVEFQYYRSISSHSATQMGDQVFVYKLDKTSGWSVTTREASIKEIKIDNSSSGTVSWSSNVVTLTSGLPKVTASDNGKILQVVNGAWAAVSPE